MSISMNYAALFTNLSGSTSASNGILNALYGISGNGTLGQADPLQALRTAETNQTTDIAQTAAEPQVARDIATFQSAVASAASPAALLTNPTVMKVLLTANGMADQIDYTALTQKALLSDPKNPTSLVNQLNAGDSRWLPMVKTYDFANKGLSVLRQSTVMATIANAYAEVTWRQSLDATTPGLSSALDFRSRASTVTNADQVLGDPVLRDVITTALGIPEQIAFQDLTAQEQAINSRLDFSQLKNQHFVDTLTQEYLLNKANAATPQSGAPTLDQLSARASGLIA